MKIIGIYKITSPNERIYIGQTRDFKSRCSDYKSLDKIIKQRRLYNSFIKYGIETHIIEFIESCEIEELNIYERKWQDYYDVTSKKGLNCVLVRTEEKPYVMTEESRLKRSKVHKGKIVSQETRDKLSILRKGVKLHPDHALAISKGSKIAKIVLDVSSGIFYDSVAEVGRTFNLDRKVLANQLSGSTKNNTQFEYIDLNKNGKGRAFESNHKYKPQRRKIINTETNEIFDHIKLAADSINMKISTLNAKLTGQNKNDTNFKYLNKNEIKI